MTITERIQKDFTTITLALIPVAIVINIVIGQIVQVYLKLPIYMDSIGTILVGVLAGPFAGAVTGILSNILWAVLSSNPIVLPFAITAGVTGLLAGFFASRGAFKNLLWTLIAGAATGCVAAFVSAPIAAFFFGGITGSGADLIVAYFQSIGANILQATLGQGIVSDPLDKAISYLIVWFILRGMSKRLSSQFPRSENIVER